jgi:predicted lipoprotein
LGDPVLVSRIAFWPDRHGTAGRQLGAALGERDPSVTDPEALAGKSAALSGLHALERLLFEDDRDATFACAYAAAILTAQARRAAEAAAVFKRATRDAAQLRQALTATIRDALDGMLRLKLEAPLGSSIGAARGQRAEFWRSNNALAMIEANLESLEALMAQPNGLSGLLQMGAQNRATAGIVEERLARATQSARAIPHGLADAVGDAASRPAVEALAGEIRELRARVVDRLEPALGVTSGFNALDGD